MIVTQYEPIYLKEVVLYDGTTYIDQSADTGDALNGDMREQIAKGLISTGINMANYGIHSTDGPSKAKHASPYIKTANWFTINNSRGKYSNGVKVHGLAGGGTVVTIIKTCRANEFAHELGHNLGMKHDGVEGMNNCSPGGYVMSPTLNGARHKWSSCSKWYLKEYC